MTDKRYQLRHEDLDYPIYSDLVDTADNDRVICTFNNDSQINKMVILLNEQDEYLNILCEKLELAYKQNKKLKKENASMKDRIINAIVESNHVECNCSPCICEKYVNEELKKW